MELTSSPDARDTGALAANEASSVKVSSSVPVSSLSLLSVHPASKAAVHAFGASLPIELEHFGINMRTVLPGSAPVTNFGSSARAKIEAKGGFHPAYADFVSAVFAGHQENRGPKTQTSDVVEAVWGLATDRDCPAVQPAGSDAVAWASWLFDTVAVDMTVATKADPMFN